MTLLDLMEVYKLRKPSDDTYALLKDMFTSANVDARIDRDILAGRFLIDCGARTPRYNTTDTFLTFGSVWLQSKANDISRQLDLLDLEYNPLIEYEERRLDDIDREHITNGEDVKSRDIDTTNTASTSETDEHLVSAENESGVQLRNRDTIANSRNEHDVIDEDVTNTTERTTTHDDTVERTTTGRKTAALDLIIKEMEKAKLNIYDTLIEDFADVMFLNVF